MQALAIVLMALQGTPRLALRTGLDTLYAGDFEIAATYFAGLAAREPGDPAPLVFQAGAYIWWASALDSADFELQRIDSLLGAAMGRARAAGPPADFWLATALGYRARQREEHGHGYSAARDAKAMRDIYRRLLRPTRPAPTAIWVWASTITAWRAPGRSRVSSRVSSDSEAGMRSAASGTCGARRMTASCRTSKPPGCSRPR